MGSPQTLSEADRRLVVAWAADCAERALPLFEAEAPGDDRPRALIARARAFARGELSTAEEVRRRFAGAVGAGDVAAPAAAAAARAAGQAVAVCHMGAHALGAAAYAAKAASLASPDRPGALEEEIRWQLDHMSAEVRAALRALPPVGENSAGPLGPGLLASGLGPTAPQHRAVVAARLPRHERPATPMVIVAVNAHAGELGTFDRGSGVDLVEAVTAGTALPGPSPTVSINGTHYITGGVRSPDN
ncbi:MAG TPA: hypothetical protein VEJ84_15710, partial [Acidimicrobiales bacterium]|nr:hypothetical protein [Acidimicrobiales bacterium]